MANRKKTVSERQKFSPFQGLPPEFIAERCAVSLGTAEHFAAGRRLPSRPSRKLYDLHREGKILGPEWDGWRIKGDKLLDPHGKHVMPRMLEMWVLIWQIAAAKDPHGLDEILERFNSA